MWTHFYSHCRSLTVVICFLWPFLCLLCWVCVKWDHESNNKSVLFLWVPPYLQNIKNYFKFSSTAQEHSRRCGGCGVNAVPPGPLPPTCPQRHILSVLMWFPSFIFFPCSGYCTYFLLVLLNSKLDSWAHCSGWIYILHSNMLTVLNRSMID